MGIHAFDPIVSRVSALYREHKNYAAAAPVLTRMQNIDRSLNASKLERGHQIFREMREKLRQIETPTYYLTKDQKTFINHMMAAVAPKVYGDELLNNELEIMRVNNFKSLKPYVLFTIPRRGGKTEAAMLCLVLFLLCIPNIRVIALAPSMRQSGSESGLVGVVRRILGYFGEKNFESNMGKVVIERSAGDIRQFYAYSAGGGDRYVYLQHIPLPRRILKDTDHTSLA